MPRVGRKGSPSECCWRGSADSREGPAQPARRYRGDARVEGRALPRARGVGDFAHRAQRRPRCGAPPRTKWTRRVPHLVLIGHADVQHGVQHSPAPPSRAPLLPCGSFACYRPLHRRSQGRGRAHSAPAALAPDLPLARTGPVRAFASFELGGARAPGCTRGTAKHRADRCPPATNPRAKGSCGGAAVALTCARGPGDPFAVAEARRWLSHPLWTAREGAVDAIAQAAPAKRRVLAFFRTSRRFAMRCTVS